MAKTIKFNLICDGYPVRTIEDLQEHFSIEDILGYYKKGLLDRWLDVRGYHKEREEVKKIQAETDSLNIIKKLIRIFDIETDEKIIEENTYILDYRNEQLAIAEKYDSQVIVKDDLVKEYYCGYINSVKNILENKSNMAVVKSAIKIIDDNYRQLFDMDYRLLFEIFYSRAPMAIFVMLMFKHMREKYLNYDLTEVGIKDQLLEGKEPVWELTRFYNKLELSIDIDKETNYIKTIRTEMYKRLTAMIRTQNNEKLKNIFGDNLRSCSSKTAPYEKVLEESGKRYMVLKIGANDKVHSYGVYDQELCFGDVNGKFVILDGLAYMSDDDKTTIYYLEV